MNRHRTFSALRAALVSLACLFSAFGSARPTAHAQETAARARYQIDVWTADQGLRGDLVLGPLIHTPDGYLWMRSVFGLTRFDGNTFAAFNAENTPAFDGSGTSQRPLLLDREGHLWIATSSGLVGYRDGRFQRGPRYEGGMLSLAEDGTGALWATSTTGKLFRSPGRASTQRLEEVSIPELPKGEATGVATDADDNIWVGFTPGGAVRITASTSGRLVVRAFGTPDGLGSESIFTVSRGRDGVVWMAGPKAITRIDKGALSPIMLPEPSEDVMGIAEGAEGAAWLATYGTGLLRYDPASRTVHRVRRSDGLAHDRVVAVTIDPSGSVWAATVQGLSRLHDTVFATVPVASGLTPSPGCFVRGDDGEAWLSVEGGGLYRSRSSQRGRFTRIDLPGSGHILSLSPGRDHALWIARGYDGALRLTDAGARPFRVADGSLLRNAISIFEDRSGTLWIGTGNGLLRVRGQSETRLTEQDGLHGPNVHSFVEGANGAIWAAGTEGVTRITDHAVQAYREAQSVPASVALRGVASTFRDRDGTIWIGTQTGLTRLVDHPEGPRFVTLRSRHGLPENWITDIVEDAFGSLWLVGLEGIARVSRAELNAVADGRKPLLDGVTVFSKRDGLPSAAIAAGGNCQRAFRDDRGQVWFSLARGVATADPARLPVDTLPPQVHVVDVVVDGTSMPMADGLTVPPGTKRVELRYTGVDLRAGDAVRFSHRLEGFEAEWVDAGTTRAVSYTNLVPGTYRFSVRARNAAGRWSAQAATVGFEVQPPFYRRWWFLGSVAFTLLVGLWTAYRARERVMQARFDGMLAERSRVAREMHDTLLSGVAGVALRLDAASQRASTATPGPLGAELSELRDVVHHMLKDARRAVGDLRHPPSQEGLHAGLVRTARRVFTGTGIEISHSCEGHPPTYPPALHAQVVRIVQEALTNARAHSGATTVSIECVERNGEVRITVKDNGRGFTDTDRHQPHEHFGILGMKERALEIGAHLAIESRPGAGTLVTLAIPPLARLNASTPRVSEHRAAI